MCECAENVGRFAIFCQALKRLYAFVNFKIICRGFKQMMNSDYFLCKKSANVFRRVSQRLVFEFNVKIVEPEGDCVNRIVWQIY